MRTRFANLCRIVSSSELTAHRTGTDVMRWRKSNAVAGSS